MLFDRPKYKEFAKKQLKGRWGVPILVTLVTALILVLFQIPDIIRLVTNQGFRDLLTTDYASFYEYVESYNNVMSSATTNLTSLIQSLVEAILVVASLNLYLKMSRSPEKVSFSSFIEGMNNWWRAILCSLYKSIFVTLWTLCFVIPGIIKTYAYSQMEYLIAEFENISIPQAMNISKIITNGKKWSLFVMDLSFIGWELLAALSLGIGSLWLIPYKKMSYINAYHAMLKDALEQGLIKPEDLQ